MLGSAYYDAMASGQPVGIVGAYQNAIDAVIPGASQAAMQATGPGDDYLSQLIRVAGQLAVTSAQRRVIEAQAAQLQANQPPIPPSQYAQVSQGMPSWLWMAAAAGAGLYFLTRRR